MLNYHGWLRQWSYCLIYKTPERHALEPLPGEGTMEMSPATGLQSECEHGGRFISQKTCDSYIQRLADDGQNSVEQLIAYPISTVTILESTAGRK